ncbi:uncharacterized protein FIBRA_08898 [Fibroporia radiculosa]|uniref:Uncharacterized protein n=1 Tax=Fibroporia radiculosa TaxID=599839 RepID=J4H5E9_9APHY|nr:uncharacterized protein FIBRA_08898 [Fibroporia radiculosa]CCM06619.1 predicted protein [Fibroporia radiculosa]
MSVTLARFLLPSSSSPRASLTKSVLLWGKHFLPGAVRVEPYKIHVYGPGDILRSGKKTKALAPSGLEADFCPKIEEVLGQLQIPCGLLLTHEYPVGTTEPMGFNNDLRSAFLAVAKNKDAYVRFLPVLTRFVGKCDYPDFQDDFSGTSESVVPFTTAHVDALLAALEAEPHVFRVSNGETSKKQMRNPTRRMVNVRKAEHWTASMQNVPFYSANVKTQVMLLGDGTRKRAQSIPEVKLVRGEKTACICLTQWSLSRKRPTQLMTVRKGRDLAADEES